MGDHWFTKRAISLHLALVVFVPTFLALGWWQLRRALSGNGLSWAYTFEWPIFAGYAVFMWWRIVHDQGEEPQPSIRAQRSSRAANRQAKDAKADVELAGYNAYLASLAEPGADDTTKTKGCT